MQAGHVIPVLDLGYIKLIDWMGSDETAIEAARMSTGRGFEGWDPGEVCSKCRWRIGNPTGGCEDNGSHHIMVKTSGDAKLLSYLYSHRHMTPFEMSELCIEVKAPIFVFREWHRHRTQSYNEHSARYAVMPDEHYVPDPSRMQKQSTTNKQGSEDSFSEDESNEMIVNIRAEQESVYINYEQLLQSGVAREIARINTPVSRYSKMRAKANLRNWLGFLALRMDESAQWEIRQYANAVASIVKVLWPRTFALFVEIDLLSVRMSNSETELIRMLATPEAIASIEFDEEIKKKLMSKLSAKKT